MSLIIGMCSKEGILLASDSFVFDNDSELPQKQFLFDNVVVSAVLNLAYTSVGSSWVAQEFHNWLNITKIPTNQLLIKLSSKWSTLNNIWKTKREKEISNSNEKTLRPISDSLLILANASDLKKIYTIDSEGNIGDTKTFVVAGSGRYLVEYLIKNEKITLKSFRTPLDCLSFIQKCYNIAKSDLYITGFPSIVIITPSKIIDLSPKCHQLWTDINNKYFADLKSELQKQLKII